MTAGGWNYQGTPPKKVQVIVNGSETTDAVCLLTQPYNFPTDYVMTNTKATLAKIGNVWTNNSMFWCVAYCKFRSK
jgi:hypothetical protein